MVKVLNFAFCTTWPLISEYVLRDSSFQAMSFDKNKGRKELQTVTEFCSKYDYGIFFPAIIFSLSSSDILMFNVISNYIEIQPIISVIKYSDRYINANYPLALQVRLTYVAQKSAQTNYTRDCLCAFDKTK
jgi:hypothetical protein